MDEQAQIGRYLKNLLDELAINLSIELAVAGFAEIKPSHVNIFQHIGPDGSRITELALHARITKQSISALVYQLETWGYLKRSADSRDKRGVLFFLTEKGELLQQIRVQINADFERRLESKLGINNYQRFKESLQKLNK